MTRMRAHELKGAARLRDAGGDPKERLGGVLEYEDTATSTRLQHLRRRWLQRRGVSEPMASIVSAIAFTENRESK